MARRSMPAQKPGLSKQDYATPAVFVEAVERRFGKLQVDLAATARNAKASRYVTPREDSLALRWYDHFRDKRCWLNPPFQHIDPWATKCASEGLLMGCGMVLFLTPASIGSNWFAEHVHHQAFVLALQGRLSFDGIAPYPKDCMLSVFGPKVTPGFDVWNWRVG
jgi:phage N-6-adenine-methyltransferase